MHAPVVVDCREQSAIKSHALHPGRLDCFLLSAPGCLLLGLHCEKRLSLLQHASFLYCTCPSPLFTYMQVIHYSTTQHNSTALDQHKCYRFTRVAIPIMAYPLCWKESNPLDAVSFSAGGGMRAAHGVRLGFRWDKCEGEGTGCASTSRPYPSSNRSCWTSLEIQPLSFSRATPRAHTVLSSWRHRALGAECIHIEDPQTIERICAFAIASAFESVASGPRPRANAEDYSGRQPRALAA